MNVEHEAMLQDIIEELEAMSEGGRTRLLHAFIELAMNAPDDCYETKEIGDEN